MTENIKLFHGDCLGVMEDIPDKSVDMILCDLPYGTTACKWDSVIPFDNLWQHYNRVVKDGGAIVLFGSQPFTSQLIHSNVKNFKYEWIWQKNRGSNFATVKYQPFKEHESVLVFSKNGKKTNYYPIKEERKGEGASRAGRKFFANNTGKREVYNGMVMTKEKTSEKISELRFPSSVQKFNCEVGLHPTQKPVALLEYLVKTYTNEGEVVLDNCMGSGSTGVACMNTNRRFIGIELDENYFNIAKDRIKQTYDQIQE